MNWGLTEKEYNSLPSKEDIDGLPIFRQPYKDKDGGVCLPVSTRHDHDWSSYQWFNYNVTITDENGRLM